MDRMVECVPNFSEGRDSAVVQALVEAVTSVPDVFLLDRTMDADHHRSVLTFAGAPEALAQAAYRAIRTAADLIDLRRHAGVHPRIGAADVVPFVPLRGASMDDCVRLARLVGRKVGAELGIPVFLYGEAAALPDRAGLEAVRKGGPEGLAVRMASDPAWRPDYGPSELHQTAGAVAIGARPALVAFNVNLATTDLSVAESIARSVRQSSGGLPCVKAMGVPLASRGLVQVSMNLTDYRVTSMDKAFQAVKVEAARRGVGIAESELVGLAPSAALDSATAEGVQLKRFDPMQVLEAKLASILPSR